MNKKIFIAILIAAVILPITAFVGFMTFSLDVFQTNDGKVTSTVHGISGNFTSSELAEMAKIIILGDVQSVSLVEEQSRPDDARFKTVYTHVEIKPTEILKGTPVLNSNGNVLLRMLGGETANYRTVTDNLILSEGDHMFLYLGMNKGETSTYIPVSSDIMYVVREDVAKDKMDNLVDLDELVKKHKDIIKELP